MGKFFFIFNKSHRAIIIILLLCHILTDITIMYWFKCSAIIYIPSTVLFQFEAAAEIKYANIAVMRQRTLFSKAKI